MGQRKLHRCVYCGTDKLNRPSGDSGLCNACMAAPDKGRRGVGDHCGGYKPPATPIMALAGSDEKLKALEERAALGVALWHPQDAQRSLR
jgi:hypothetical protein